MRMQREKFYLTFLIVCSLFPAPLVYSVEPDCHLSHFGGVIKASIQGVGPFRGELQDPLNFKINNKKSSFGFENDHDLSDLFKDFMKFQNKETKTPPDIRGEIKGYDKSRPGCDFEFIFSVKSLSIEKRELLPDGRLADPVESILKEGETITPDTITRFFLEELIIGSRPTFSDNFRQNREEGLTEFDEIEFNILSRRQAFRRIHRRTTVLKMSEQLDALLFGKERVTVTEGNRICSRINIEEGEFTVFSGYHYPSGRKPGKAILVRIAVSGYVQCCCPVSLPSKTLATPTEDDIGTGGGAGGASGAFKLITVEKSVDANGPDLTINLLEDVLAKGETDAILTKSQTEEIKAKALRIDISERDSSFDGTLIRPSDPTKKGVVVISISRDKGEIIYKPGDGLDDVSGGRDVEDFFKINIFSDAFQADDPRRDIKASVIIKINRAGETGTPGTPGGTSPAPARTIELVPQTVSTPRNREIFINVDLSVPSADLQHVSHYIASMDGSEFTGTLKRAEGATQEERERSPDRFLPLLQPLGDPLSVTEDNRLNRLTAAREPQPDPFQLSYVPNQETTDDKQDIIKISAKPRLTPEAKNLSFTETTITINITDAAADKPQDVLSFHRAAKGDPDPRVEEVVVGDKTTRIITLSGTSPKALKPLFIIGGFVRLTEVTLTFEADFKGKLFPNGNGTGEQISSGAALRRSILGDARFFPFNLASYVPGDATPGHEDKVNYRILAEEKRPGFETITTFELTGTLIYKYVAAESSAIAPPTEEDIGTGGGAGGASGQIDGNVTSSSDPATFREQKEKAFALAPGSIKVNPNVTVIQSVQGNKLIVEFSAATGGYDKDLFITVSAEDPITPNAGIRLNTLIRGEDRLYFKEPDGSEFYRVSTGGVAGIFGEAQVTRRGSNVRVVFTINSVERGTARLHAFFFHMVGADGVSGAHFFQPFLFSN